MFLENVIKLPVMVLCFGEPPGSFCDVGCYCCFSSLEVFTFHYFSTSSLTLPWANAGFTPIWYFQSSSSQSDSWHLHFNFSGLFSFTVSATVLSGHFHPQAFFTLRSFTDIFGTFLWFRCRQEHPIQDFPLCLPSQSCPFRLAHGLELVILQIQRHWFIDCASEPRSIELKLNYWICFACSKYMEWL